MHARKNSQPNIDSVSFVDEKENNFRYFQTIQKSKVLLKSIKEFFLKSISSSLSQEDKILLRDIRETFLRHWNKIFRQLENIHTKRALIKSIKSVNQLTRVLDYYGACKFKMEIFNLSDVELGIPTGQTYKLNQKEQTKIVLELYQHFFEEVLTQERYSKNYTNEEITNFVQPKIIQRLQKKGILAVASRNDKAGKAYHARMKIVALDLYELDERLDNFLQKNDSLRQSYFKSSELKYLRLMHNYDQFMKMRERVNETKEKEFIRDFDIHLKRIDSLLLSEFRNNTAADFVNLSKERTYDENFYKQFFLFARSRTLELKKQSLIDTKNLLVGKIENTKNFFKNMKIFSQFETEFSRIDVRIQRYQKMPLNRSLFLLRNLVDQLEHVQECYLAANLKLIPFTLHDVELGVQGSAQTYRLELQEQNSILHKICKTVFDAVVLENSVGKRYINKELVSMVKNLVTHALKNKVPLVFKPFSKEKASYDARFAALDLDSFSLGNFQRKSVSRITGKSTEKTDPTSFIRRIYWQPNHDNKIPDYMHVVQIYREYLDNFKELDKRKREKSLIQIKNSIALIDSAVHSMPIEHNLTKNKSYDAVLNSKDKSEENKYEILIALCLQSSLKQIGRHADDIERKAEEMEFFSDESEQFTAKKVRLKIREEKDITKETETEQTAAELPEKIEQLAEKVTKDVEQDSFSDVSSSIKQEDNQRIITDQDLKNLNDSDRVAIGYEFNRLLKEPDGLPVFDQAMFQFLLQRNITFEWQKEDFEKTIDKFKDTIDQYLRTDSLTKTSAQSFLVTFSIAQARLTEAQKKIKKELDNRSRFWHNSETKAKLNKMIQVIDSMLALHKKIDMHLRKILNLKKEIEGLKLVENLLDKIREIINNYPDIILRLKELVPAYYGGYVPTVLEKLKKVDVFKILPIISKLSEVHVIWAQMQKDKILKEAIRVFEQIALSKTIRPRVTTLYDLLMNQKRAEVLPKDIIELRKELNNKLMSLNSVEDIDTGQIRKLKKDVHTMTESGTLSQGYKNLLLDLQAFYHTELLKALKQKQVWPSDLPRDTKQRSKEKLKLRRSKSSASEKTAQKTLKLKGFLSSDSLFGTAF